MKLSALKRKARAAGAGEEMLDDCDDAPDPKEQVVLFLLEAHRSRPAPGGARADPATPAVSQAKKPMRSHLGKAAPAAAASSVAKEGLKVPPDVPAARTTKTLLLPNMHIMLSYQWVSMQPRLFCLCLCPFSC
jgi:hypothetical protein